MFYVRQRIGNVLFFLKFPKKILKIVFNVIFVIITLTPVPDMKNNLIFNIKRLWLRTLLFSMVLVRLSAQELPEMPQEYIETCMPATSQVISVCAAGCNYNNNQLQQAINAATPGTTITLEAGVSYTGSFTFPEKTGEGWIVIRSNAPDDSLPANNTRISPAYAPHLAKLVAKPNQTVATLNTRAHHYYFFGLEFMTEAFAWNIVIIGNGETVLDDLPHDIVFDRVYMHGHATLGTRRAIAMNGRRVAVVNSYLSNFKEQGADSQALAAWNGTTFKVVNNYLEGAAENILFGGAVTKVNGLVLSDIEVRNNYFYKPLSWKADDPSYEGIDWSIKNLFELKNAGRIWIKGNIFENNWADSQTGFAILLTPRTEQGACPWITVHDVIFEDNIIRHTGSGFNISGKDDSYPTIHTDRVLIRNNLMEDINGDLWGGDGRVLQVLGGVYHLTVEHNTFLNSLGKTFIEADSPNFPSTDFTYRDNITSNAKYGAHGSGTGIGNSCLNTYFPGAVFTHNVLADGTSNNGGIPSGYPPDNYFPGPMQNIGFQNYNSGIGGDYHLLPASDFVNAGTDGKDIGADMDSVQFFTADVVPGIFPVCNLSTGVAETPGQAQTNPPFFLAPNPGQDFFELIIPDGDTRAWHRLIIYNANGQQVTPAFLEKSEMRWRVGAQNLPAGIYWVQLVGINGSGVAKWIKW